jgi:hypothetical protein
MDELPTLHREFLKAVGHQPLDEVDPEAIAADLGLPIEAVEDVLSAVEDLSAGERERLLGRLPTPGIVDPC